jgi:SAM-dependent methyltransferase
VRDREEVLRRLAELDPDERDGAIERLLGIEGDVSSRAPGAELVGHHASGIAAIARFLLEVPMGPEDVFVDLGSGLGKVALLAALLTPARVVGVELQGDLVDRARLAATTLGVEVSFVEGDMREIRLDGTAFYLYAPCTPRALGAVIARLREVAERRAIVVGALGIELRADWLVPRDADSFWLSIYDSVLPDVPARVAPPSSLPFDAADAIARELDVRARRSRS